MKRLLILGTTLVLIAPATVAYAQEAALSGTVTDTTGGALPGVTVQAVHEASGNSFEAVTNDRGEYRIAARVGAYRVTADLAGFTPATRTVTVLVGQEAVVNLQMGVSGVQESVTVTGEAPLLNTTESSLGANIDPLQMQELPIQGRNWVGLVLMAPGARLNAVEQTPSDTGPGIPSSGRTGGDFQLNVDGQQVTTIIAGANQTPQGKFSKDAMAEFEFLSSRFDALQGRSSQLQVNAVTKSGSNEFSGLASGYFRHDRFNAANHVVNRVLPYENQQFSGTFGGPIVRDKAHFFASYEHEREPRTVIYNTPFPHFNIDLSDNASDKKALGRVDVQFSPQTRLMGRSNYWSSYNLSGGSNTAAPSSQREFISKTSQHLATLTSVPNSRFVNELKGGFNWIRFRELSMTKNVNAFVGGVGGPVVLFRGFAAGPNTNPHDVAGADVYQIRDDLTFLFSKGGRHTLKTGAEFIHQTNYDSRCIRCEGELLADRGPVPDNATMAQMFPNLFDATTWNLTPLSSITALWRQQFFPGGSADVDFPRYSTGLWLQDDWTVSPRLTLNLGVRYDVELNAFANDVTLPPFLTGDQPNDLNNLSPRVGFTYSVNDRTVLRGGYGTFFGTVVAGHYGYYYEKAIALTVLNDGRADFASNPFNGPAPTYESLLARLCTAADPFAPGCIRKEVQTGGIVFGPDVTMPYAHQGSIGLQRQLAADLGVEVDYVYSGHRDDPRDLPVNIAYNPETGVNYPFTDLTRKPFPEWGYVSLTVNGYRSNLHSLQTAFTKRFSRGWQASGNYTLSWLRDAYPFPIQWNSTAGEFERVPFPTAPDLGGEYGLAAGDQRHRATVNGIWEAGYGFQVSGLYFFGSGMRWDTRWGTDLRQIGDRRPNTLRLRPDGTLVPRNNFVGDQIHRVDLRLMRRFPLGGDVQIDGLLEVFNVFNRANFGTYNTQESSSNYGQPSNNENVAYAPRMLQLGFRLVF
jgi:hypothetical protein